MPRDVQRTTVRLDDSLIEQAKREACRRGEKLAALIEQGLRIVLARSHKPHQCKRVKLPVSNTRGGTYPGIDVTNSAALRGLMEERG